MISIPNLHYVRAFNDNYIWIYELKNKKAIIIDPGESQPVIDYCMQSGLEPIAILITHHHDDHTGGVEALSAIFSAIKIYAPDEVKFNHISITDYFSVTINEELIKIIPVPGHTLQHTAYLIKGILFSGDTLFSAGCGRVFEGTYEQMFRSLNTLKLLPNETLVCPAHEYTYSNLLFAHEVDPDNVEVKQLLIECKDKSMTLPTSIGKEKRINPFFFEDFTRLNRKYFINTDFDLFTFFREKKNNF